MPETINYIDFKNKNKEILIRGKKDILKVLKHIK